MNNRNILANNQLFRNQNQMKLKHSNKKILMGKYNIIYLNINSIRNKLDELEDTINDLQNKCGKIVHFVALVESKISEHDVPYVNLPNYLSFHCTRSDGYGGCALFVHESLACNLICKKSCHGIELLAVGVVELKLNITVVYKQTTNGEWKRFHSNSQSIHSERWQIDCSRRHECQFTQQF